MASVVAAEKLLSGWGLTARPCDACRTAAALVYCGADAAFLCGACDSRVHAAAHTRHGRVWVCEVCEQAPAAVACKADAAVLCSACDRDIHSANPLARRHDRDPIVPFTDSTADAAARSSASAATSFLVPLSDDPGKCGGNAPGAGAGAEAEEEAWLIPNPDHRNLMADFLCSAAAADDDSDLLGFGFGFPPSSQNLLEKSGNNRSFAITDSVVPSHSKNNNNNNNLSFNENRSLFDDTCFDIDFSQPDKFHKLFNLPSAQHSVSSSDIGVVPDGTSNSVSEVVSCTFSRPADFTTGALDGGSPAAPATALDREARVLRYREKRKNRRFEKTIRYASRKAYAETRPRIKGRFAKRTEASETSEIDQIYGLHGYGVVPSF